MFFKCTHRSPADNHQGGHVVSKGLNSKIVDIHCHRECAQAAEMMKAEAKRVGFAALSFGSELTKEVNNQQLIDIKPKMESLDERIKDMDRMGVDIQAISFWLAEWLQSLWTICRLSIISNQNMLPRFPCLGKGRHTG